MPTRSNEIRSSRGLRDNRRLQPWSQSFSLFWDGGAPGPKRPGYWVIFKIMARITRSWTVGVLALFRCLLRRVRLQVSEQGQYEKFISSSYCWMRKGVFCAVGSGSVYKGQTWSTCYKMHEIRRAYALFWCLCAPGASLKPARLVMFSWVFLPLKISSLFSGNKIQGHISRNRETSK